MEFHVKPILRAHLLPFWTLPPCSVRQRHRVQCTALWALSVWRSILGQRFAKASICRSYREGFQLNWRFSQFCAFWLNLLNFNYCLVNCDFGYHFNLWSYRGAAWNMDSTFDIRTPFHVRLCNFQAQTLSRQVCSSEK